MQGFGGSVCRNTTIGVILARLVSIVSEDKDSIPYMGILTLDEEEIKAQK